MKISQFLYLIFLITVCHHIACAQENNLDATEYKVDQLPFAKSNINYCCAVPYNKGLIFSANINKDLGVIYYNESDEADFADLYYIEPKSDGFWTRPKPFSKTINSNLHESAFAFDTTRTQIYFTTNREYGKSNILDSKKPLTLKIYKANLENGKWDNFEAFTFNSDTYNVAHPSISADGKKLFFTSDMPGGYGGTDIYLCYWHQGQWSKPVNLGKQVNTKSNETFPFIASDEKLYFSSEGRKGFGKMDIYYSEFINSEWKNVRNLGIPINSEGDDYSFYLDPVSLQGYFTSNRAGNQNDKLFKFRWFKTDCQTFAEIEHCYTFYENANIEPQNLPLAYEWSMGDGTKIRGLEAGHCYANSGKFQVQLNIIDTVSNQLFFNEANYEIEIAPIFNPYFEIAGVQKPMSELNFSGIKSKLPKVKITDMIWDFGDGVKSIGFKANHTYKKIGKYKVKLEVQGKDTLKRDVEHCVYKYISITEDGQEILEENDSLTNSAVDVIAVDINNKNNIRNISKDSITYKVQLMQSDKQIATTPQNFNGLENVKEYEHDGLFGYTVGENNDLVNLYPLYNEVRIKGFKDAYVVAFDKNNKVIVGIDTTKKQLIDGRTYTLLSGRVMTRYGEPLQSTIIVEDLISRKIVKELKVNIDGRFIIEIGNGNLYGFFAKKDSFYCVSNFLDLRNEVRNLDVKKNIEMIQIAELNDEAMSIRVNNLFFDVNDFSLDSTSIPELERLIAIFKSRKNFVLQVSGHTDNVGDEKYNQKLSLKRANAVKDYLVSEGCSKEKIETNGYGSSRPLVTNTTERGRYINRRVEIKFLSP